MTGTTKRVATQAELKEALRGRADVIIITNKKLAQHVKLAKHAKKGVVLAVLAAGGVAAANWWNPIGWGAGAGAVGIGTASYLVAGGAATAGLSTGATIVSVTGILALAGLGTLFMVMYNDYEMEGKAGAKAGMKSSAGTGEGGSGPSMDNSAGGKFEFKLTKRHNA